MEEETPKETGGGEEVPGETPETPEEESTAGEGTPEEESTTGGEIPAQDGQDTLPEDSADEEEDEEDEE